MQVSHFKKNRFVRGLVLASAASLLPGCFDEDGNVLAPAEHYAVISTQAAGGGSGDISIVSLEDYSADNKNYAGLSDTVISTYGENFYRIGRFKQDNITKFHIDSPEDIIWQFSANGEGEELSNPYKLVVKNENMAYLIRYGQPSIWIVDPSVANTAADSFVIGEIDLSSYTADESDTRPEAADALLIDNKLYVLIQNLDANWTPGIAYIAVFDTENSHAEIATNTDSATPLGVPLKATNPSKMEYLSTNNTLYVSGIGSWANTLTNPVTPPDYAGGIEQINLSDYTTQIIVDDGETYGQTTNIAILSSTRGYFIGYSAWKDTAVYSFNPTTGVVDATALLENADISDIEIGPLGNLWVSNRDESGITIYSTVDNSVFKALIDTDLKPNDIEFISVSGN